MTSAEVTERAIAEILEVSTPLHLRDRLAATEARQRVSEHLDAYHEEKARFPDQQLLPWRNWLAYDSEWEETFFVVLILKEKVVDLFCGTGVWPVVRSFGEREADDIPVSEWHREWAMRFAVPCPPLVLSKAVVKEWIGRDW